ncbi:hypothetical protein RD792_011649 [Penstemon davidsonii]|uniref:Uncharacterized protein n=1 Tax=Penstemon davidsonii TaxID=160366 RepID=A0ABR0CUP2_9LAMI|nr:hypothetical protein RD792_011649 [Penstemon davidsonii]
MSFLHKIWDETLAGPTPDSGLGKLRKYNSFAATRSADSPPLVVVPPPSDDSRFIPIPRSISAVNRNNLTVSVDSASLPSSPVGSSTPTSPFSPSTPPAGNFKKLTRRKSLQNSKSKGPNGYD